MYLNLVFHQLKPCLVQGIFMVNRTDASLYEDAGKLVVGPVGGVNRGTKEAVGDNTVVIRMTYDIPKSQSITGEPHHSRSSTILF